jgi:hypothetical protein
MNTKRIIITILWATLLYAVAHKAYYYFFRPHQIATVALPVADSELPLKAPQFPSNGHYNYRRMIALVDQAREIKSAFNELFTGVSSKKSKPVDVSLTKEVLADLYREKVRLSKYAVEMRVRYKGQVPRKKRQAIIFYQQVVDRCIRDLEAVLRQI